MKALIRPIICSAPKCYAANVMPTWGMYFLMALHPQDSGIALTARLLSSQKTNKGWGWQNVGWLLIVQV